MTDREELLADLAEINPDALLADGLEAIASAISEQSKEMKSET